MSSATSAVTYTSVYTDSEPGRAFWGADNEEDEDEHEFPAEEQPLPPVDSPIAESPGHVTESDPEEDPEEYEDDKTEDGPVYYPMDGGDDDDGDSSRDDADSKDEDEEDEDEEEEEHVEPTRGQGIDYGFVSTVDAEERRQGIRGVGYGIKGSQSLLSSMSRYTGLRMDSPRDSMDGRGGGLCFSRGLGSLDRIESGDSSGASDPS
ncbi:hypothetical protein Tco_0674099 [Tanacetum coccineum]